MNIQAHEWANINKSVKDDINDLNVNFYKTKEKSGHVIISFPDKETRDQANEKILSNKDLSVKFSMKTPKKMLPKVTITGINKVLFEAGDVPDKRA